MVLVAERKDLSTIQLRARRTPSRIKIKRRRNSARMPLKKIPTKISRKELASIRKNKNILT